MNTSTRPKAPTIIASLLAVIALFSVISTVSGRLGIARPQGTFPANGNFQPGTVNFQQGNGNFQQGNGDSANNYRTFTGRGGGLGIFSLFGLARSLGLGNQAVAIISYISSGISVIGILLTLWAAYGVWKQKRRALNLAIALALIFLVSTLAGLFGGIRLPTVIFFSILRTVLNWGTALATLPIIVMGLTPSVRDFVS